MKIHFRTAFWSAAAVLVAVLLVLAFRPRPVPVDTAGITRGPMQVSVRDEGPGIADGRLEEAESEGRLGVSESIRGRMSDLGGTARLTTGTAGTEWELAFPRGGHTSRA